MLRLVALLALFPVAASAQAVEDEAHRLDRLRTEQLNKQALSATTKRDRHGSDDARVDYDNARADYDDARADYQRRLARWRAQVDACNRSIYEACDRR
ncbi:hypothetical protein HL653_18245 [Sphingomonas sp. AP4-R1]|uniref:hypothetical protein n=1 Tax=Sphingomonas sp. AP4-R1 TaxID=2735134 RepID=UPI001493D8FF|nr:hypothetical protein [Sphingomonas sp. AP4-R1]QJU59436.1 hypothetical protein HL653_18245 [Sphingomonas sp. AP4-R1]